MARFASPCARSMRDFAEPGSDRNRALARPRSRASRPAWAGARRAGRARCAAARIPRTRPRASGPRRGAEPRRRAARCGSGRGAPGPGSTSIAEPSLATRGQAKKQAMPSSTRRNDPGPVNPVIIPATTRATANSDARAGRKADELVGDEPAHRGRLGPGSLALAERQVRRGVGQRRGLDPRPGEALDPAAVQAGHPGRQAERGGPHQHPEPDDPGERGRDHERGNQHDEEHRAGHQRGQEVAEAAPGSRGDRPEQDRPGDLRHPDGLRRSARGRRSRRRLRSHTGHDTQAGRIRAGG